MTDEVEYAMKYASERRMRINLERRLLGLIFETFPYMQAAGNFLDGVLENDEPKMTESMRNLVAWRMDLEVQLLINIIKPAGTVLETHHWSVASPEELPEIISPIPDILEPFALEVREEYEKSRQECPNIASLERARDKNIQSYVEKIGADALGLIKDGMINNEDQETKIH